MVDSLFKFSQSEQNSNYVNLALRVRYLKMAAQRIIQKQKLLYLYWLRLCLRFEHYPIPAK